jgi:uncharacterized Rmd1/YagE family protein
MTDIVSVVKGLCTPALVSLFLGTVSMLLNCTRVSILTSILHLIVTVIWALFLDFLCEKGFTFLSWFLVLLPYLLVFFSIFFLFGAKMGAKYGKKGK